MLGACTFDLGDAWPQACFTAAVVPQIIKKETFIYYPVDSRVLLFNRPPPPTLFLLFVAPDQR